MKILHILYSGLGGHGNVFFSMVKADKEKSFEYEAIFCGIEDIREEYVTRCTANNIKYHFIKKTAGKHVSYYYKIFKQIKKSKPDIIFLHGSMQLPSAWLAKLLLSKSKIIVRETQALHLKTTFENVALKVAMKLADKIVFLSNDYMKQVSIHFGKKFKASKCSVIPNGIDLNKFAPLASNNVTQISIGMQSRIVAIKDHSTLIAAFKQLKEKLPEHHLKLYLAGDGEKKISLEEETKKLHLQNDVIFEGMLNENALVYFLQKLDVYVHASFGETMSTAIMQAMACGKAIVASDVDGINNMITNQKDGLLVPVNQVNEMANAIETIILNPVLKASLEAAALNTATQKFSDRQMFLSYKAIIDTL
ncbi:glycosyltransferase family 4 protein [Ferruginibacter yonginensis]|uniref:Glycosyltransferase family 4 protein n=1 Tax=Ferruginibacter yonginensis TaxID=1310416 RepID=A0ABV8QUU9_9BACT